MFEYLDGLLRYFEFSGRSSRTQYWAFQMVSLLLLIGAVYLDYRMTGVLFDREHPGFFTLFVVFVHFVPGITVTVRRLHDAGRSGWWYWISMIPVVGTVWLIVLLCAGPDGIGPNIYGEDPRDAPALAFGRSAPKVSRTQEFLAQMEARRNAARI